MAASKKFAIPPKSTSVIDWQTTARIIGDELSSTAPQREAETRRPITEIQRLREAGLLTLTIPAEYGGGGLNWQSALRIVREIARGDGSVGAIFGYHLLDLAIPFLSGTPEQRERFDCDSARHRWFWGGVINPLDAALVAKPDGNSFVLNGRKTFCTGATLADRIIVNAELAGSDAPAYFIVPADRKGISPGNDWNNLGFRLTESCSVTFIDVHASADELLGVDGRPPDPVRSSLAVPMIQMMFTNLYLGSALGALNASRAYTLTTARPWLLSGLTEASEDPYVVEHYGELWVKLSAAIALAEQAATSLQSVIDQIDSITPRIRGESSVNVATAKVFAARTALEITSRIFELMGARATAKLYGFDRFWRDVRTHTLHDPISYKVREVGDFFLNNRVPEPTFYS
jgi:alkylation response protein AidB-like acyl-CoA dehydrogenase